MVELGGLNIPAHIVSNRQVSKTTPDRQLSKRDTRNAANRKKPSTPARDRERTDEDEKIFDDYA